MVRLNCGCNYLHFNLHQILNWNFKILKELRQITFVFFKGKRLGPWKNLTLVFSGNGLKWKILWFSIFLRKPHVRKKMFLKKLGKKNKRERSSLPFFLDMNIIFQFVFNMNIYVIVCLFIFLVASIATL